MKFSTFFRPKFQSPAIQSKIPSFMEERNSSRIVVFHSLGTTSYLKQTNKQTKRKEHLHAFVCHDHITSFFCLTKMLHKTFGSFPAWSLAAPLVLGGPSHYLCALEHSCTSVGKHLKQRCTRDDQRVLENGGGRCLLLSPLPPSCRPNALAIQVSKRILSRP